MIDVRETVRCELCGAHTPMTATKRCDRCWELETRIESDPVLARKILNRHEQPTTDEWSYNYDGDRYHIRAVGNSDCVAHADRFEQAEQIVNDHNWRLRREQPARVDDDDEWRVLETGSRTKVIDESGDTVALGAGRNARQRQEHATQIVSDHNRHQQCATQLQFLGDRLEAQAEVMSKVVHERNGLREKVEELSSLLAGMTTERDGLRAVLRQTREQIEFLEQALEEYHGSRQPNPALDAIDAALNHAGQGEGS